MPLWHVATGSVDDGVPVRGIARGWVAVGDVAFGVLFAAGGIAVGGVAVGGLATGIVVVGGLAIGALAVAGLSIGALAAAGAAFAWWGAMGGLAGVRHVALGGVAVAPHANDAVAQALGREHPFFVGSGTLLEVSIVFALLTTVAAVAARLRARRASARGRG